MKIIEKVGVLSIMGILLVFIIVISSSYAYFRPTIQGNDTAKTITLSSKKIPPHPLFGVLEDLADEGTYAATYTGDSNDTYGVTGTKKIHYIKTTTEGDTTQANNLLNKINVKFAGFCWQLLRTTDTGGVKLIYNGEPDSNGYCKAQNTADTHLGIVGTAGTSDTVTGSYMYANTFTYNLNTKTFTLENPTSSNYLTDKSLIGKYTCKNNDTPSTCTTLYYLAATHSNTSKAWYTTYTITDTQNAQIGTSPFNAFDKSAAYIGYRFGDTIYSQAGNSAPLSASEMGYDVYWTGSNYELREADGTSSTGKTYDDNHHYSCDSIISVSRCNGGNVRFYFRGNRYLLLKNGDTIETAREKMVTDSANTNNSTVKAYLDNWYRKNLASFSSYLDENAVYCNDRNTTTFGGFAKDGSVAEDGTQYIRFNNLVNNYLSLNCQSNKDKFSVGNTNAQLNYPIGLITIPELNLTNNNNIKKTGEIYWTISPGYVASYSYINSINANGGTGRLGPSNAYGIRPVITLKPSKDTMTGSGTLSDPYVIGSNN